MCYSDIKWGLEAARQSYQTALVHSPSPFLGHYCRSFLPSPNCQYFSHLQSQLMVLLPITVTKGKQTEDQCNLLPPTNSTHLSGSALTHCACPSLITDNCLRFLGQPTSLLVCLVTSFPTHPGTLPQKFSLLSPTASMFPSFLDQLISLEMY